MFRKYSDCSQSGYLQSASLLNKVQLIKHPFIRKRDYYENTKYETVRQAIYLE